MARNQGGGGRQQTSAPPPATATPVAAQAPASQPAVGQPSLHTKDGLKYLATVVGGFALLFLVVKPAYDWFAGMNWEAMAPGVIVLGGIGLLALLYWKWRDGFWLLVVVGLVGWVVSALPATGKNGRKAGTVQSAPEARKEVIEIRQVMVTADRFHKGGLLWEIGPWEADTLEFDAPGGVEVRYVDDDRRDPPFTIPAGTSGQYHCNPKVHQNGVRLRSLTPGTHAVKLIYSRMVQE